jgi:thymidylate synthase ThyX
MKIRHVSISPTEAATENGCYALTPELLAATGARYSRNNEGLDAIVSKIDFNNTDKSVDGIFKMVDYGHASIADMAPVTMFMDGISIYAAFVLWYLSPTAGGQESSTRYINYNDSECYLPKDGDNTSKYLFSMYEKSTSIWTEILNTYPEILNLPEGTSDKQKERFIRNFVFDRARVWLPISAKTNVMMVKSARTWVELISLLLSHPFEELKEIGRGLKEQLDLVTPRLTKHAVAKNSNKYWMESWVNSYNKPIENQILAEQVYVYDNLLFDQELVNNDLGSRENRYCPSGDSIRMTSMKYIIPRISFGELRDVNRHRTGNKFTSMRPLGFYGCKDYFASLPLTVRCDKLLLQILDMADEGVKFIENQTLNLNQRAPVTLEEIEKTLYSLPLGTQFYFEHTTTLDKFIYQCELRTGTGAHYKYFEHHKNLLDALYKKHPNLQGLIMEGSGEPE